ncbi:MAG TPA: glycosyltransferase family 9 protein [Candidatus Binataceae bacterium]|nr:glycosyltransferase family 9 protein [Candidatus Binataceae bacterium]
MPTATISTSVLLRLLALYGRISDFRRRPSPRPPHRLLVVTTGGIGDGVLLHAIIHHLRRLSPTMEVGILAGFGAAEALAGLRDARFHQYAPGARGTIGWGKLIRELRRARYDTALATDHTSFTSAAIVCLARIRCRVGFRPVNHYPQHRLFNHVVALDEGRSQWESLLELARVVEPDLPPMVEVVPLPIPAPLEAQVAAWWQAVVPAGSRVVAVHPGSGVHEFKRWPVERFVETVRTLQRAAPHLLPLLTGNGAERDLCERFRRLYGGLTINAVGVFPGVAATAAILRRCDLLISNDTGVMHLGAAMGVPTVGLFGPTSPIQWAPRGPHATYVAGPQPPCSPCIRNYRGALPDRCTNPVTGQCLATLAVDQVVGAAARVAGRWLT